MAILWDSRLLEIWKDNETVWGGMSYIIRCWYNVPKQKAYRYELSEC